MASLSLARRTGRIVLETWLGLSGIAGTVMGAAGALPVLLNPSVRTVFLRQVYFTGIQALSTVAALGALIGIVIITQVSSLVGSNAELTGRILLWTVVREMGPLFAAIIVIARSCTAVAAELASMKINDELSFLRSMGISPAAYLVVPRVAGMALSLFLLTFWFQAVAIFGGLALSSLFIQLPFLSHMQSIFTALGIFDIAASLLKSLLFGLLVAGAACYHGLRVQASITEIPQVTTRAVMQSLLAVVLIDVLVTVVFFT